MSSIAPLVPEAKLVHERFGVFPPSHEVNSSFFFSLLADEIHGRVNDKRCK